MTAVREDRDHARKSLAGRRIAWWVALVALIAIAVPVSARATGYEAGPLAMLVAFMPWVTLLCAVPLVFACFARSWLLAAMAVALTVVCVAWQIPLFSGGEEGKASLTVASVNLRFGEADPVAVVDLVADNDIDVLALTELTPEALAALADAGLSTELPYVEASAEPGFSGTGLWSRYPLSDAAELTGFLSQQLRASIATPRGDVTVFVVHPRAPRGSDHHVWDRELAMLYDVLAEADGPVIVAGDFNTTRDHASFRAIESLGYADAADQSGSGFAPTFPVGRGLFPPIVIDHVLERDAGLVALSAHTFAIAKADHKALVAEYGTAATASG